MLGQRRRRWPNIKQPLNQRPVFFWDSYSFIIESFTLYSAVYKHWNVVGNGSDSVIVICFFTKTVNRVFEPMLFKRWYSVVDAGLTWKKHWFNVSGLQITHPYAGHSTVAAFVCQLLSRHLHVSKQFTWLLHHHHLYHPSVVKMGVKTGVPLGVDGLFTLLKHYTFTWQTKITTEL